MYSITVFTTVGYGDLVANSVLSRFLTMIYALIGIPLYIAFISDLGDFIGTKIIRFGMFLRNCIQRYRKKRKLTSNEKTRPLSRWSRFLMIFISFFVFFVFVSLITKYVEELANPDFQWTFMDSFHFVFTTITLIGFGDILTEHLTYVLIHFPFLIIGQTLCALMFYFLQRFVRYEFPHFVANACSKMNKDVDIRISRDITTLKKQDSEKIENGNSEEENGFPVKMEDDQVATVRSENS